jgi:hypothetical protein
LIDTNVEYAKKAIHRLVEKFLAHKSEYESSGYLESQLRTDFIDELFKALGWDIINRRNLSRVQREVLVEKGDTTGRPDYSFRVNGENRFFVETKTPFRGTDKPDDCFQAKSYGWNTSNVNIAVLTDFKSFKVFDTTIKPDLKKPELGLIFKLDFLRFGAEDFDRLWLFSQKSVTKGSLDIRRYRIVPPKKYVIFPYHINGSTAKLIPIAELEKNFPYGAKYLILNRKTLEAREHGKWKCAEWYAYSRNQNLVQCSKEKILTPSIAKKAAFVYDEKGSYYFLGSGGGGGGGYGLSINKKSKTNPFYLNGLLNSKLLDYLTKHNSTRFSGGFFAYNKQFIQSLPIVNPENKSQNSLRDQIAELSSKIMMLNQTIETISDSSRIKLLKREAAVYEEKIDELVYNLYGVTSEERQIVEKYDS